MSVPDRKPDEHEALTLEQLMEAVTNWLISKQRLRPGPYAVGTLEVHQLSATEGTYRLRLWREP